jgi:hypothetical protein
VDRAERPLLRVLTIRCDVVWPFAARLFEARVAAKQRFCAARGLKATLRKSLRPTGLLRMLRVLQDMNVVLPAAIEATPKEPYRAD